MQPTTNNQSTFNPLSIILLANGSIKGPTSDPADGNGNGQCSIISLLFAYAEVYQSLEYTEEENDLKIWESYENDYGPILIRMVKGNASYECIFPDKPKMHLRIIFKNSTVRAFDFDFPFNEYTYCNKAAINVSALTKDTFSLGDGIIAGSKVVNGLFKEDGILRAYQFLNGTLAWKRFSYPDIYGRVYDDGQGIFYSQTNLETLKSFFPISISSGGFACVILIKNEIDNLNQTINFTIPRWISYVSFLSKSRPISSKLIILYQTPLTSINIINTGCGNVWDGSGNGCLFLIEQLKETSQQENSTVTGISFGSQGTITAIRQLEIDIKSEYVNFYFLPLFYGGFVAFRTVTVEGKPLIGGEILNQNGDFIQMWNLDFLTSIYGYFAEENIAWGLRRSNITDGKWSIITKEFSRIKVKGYENPNILKTVPKIGEIVLSSTLTHINITYEDSILLSTKNISIYQNTSIGLILRQTCSGLDRNFQTTLNGNTISIPLLDSTLNIPNTTYLVIIDIGFVRAAISDEPFIGISEGNWFFYTGVATSGLIRLTMDSTPAFKAAIKNDSANFFNDFETKIAHIIPVNPSMINIKRHFQVDPASKQILLRINISPGRSHSDNSVDITAKNLNSLIKNRDFTRFSMENYTSWIDGTYGFQETVDLWDKYKFTLFIALGSGIILMAIYFYARHLNKQYPHVAAISTLFASTNIEILHILSSRIAGLQIFSATFSKHGELIYYWQNTIIHDIVTLITICSSGVFIFHTIIVRLYHGVLHFQKKNQPNYNASEKIDSEYLPEIEA
ncbi:hypothetical protein G9A89_017804 [Geosiphon pyriformis]|nr:hypothetical protein G9A89_017804 [Geosiphon pyriformis]